MSSAEQVEKAAYRPREFMEAFGIGRTKFYRMVKRGDLKILKSCRATLIPVASVDRWIAACEAEAVASRVKAETRANGAKKSAQA